ncbi:hypothetical protein OG478_20560 [Streptomyces phaeochromogenes]|uniref:hypothetical protein n=1 Tax=Streptomyces phaeochromogenes TaxID=1923 RepID=UPI00386A59AB|nr:hypothetical protein OG478_20560 [Streptomyces phaeochromogenes]
MLTEIMVAAIGAVGALAVAFLARSGPRRERRERSVPLLALSEYCGHIRGVAEAAVADCERTIDLLGGRKKRRPVSWSAHETYDAFIEKTSLEMGGQQDFAGQLPSYTSMVDEFAARLRALCEDLDKLTKTPTPGQIRFRAQALRQLKNREFVELDDQLPKLDEQFAALQTVWLDRVRPLVSTGAPRYFSRRSSRLYSRFVAMGKNAEFVHPRVPRIPDSGSSQAASSDPPGANPPACNHCIWQCPHAPGVNAVAATTAALLDDADPETSSSPRTNQQLHDDLDNTTGVAGLPTLGQ